MNAAFALIQAVAPKNEIEGALAIQMACTHSAAMAALSRAASVGGRAFSGYFSSFITSWASPRTEWEGLPSCALHAVTAASWSMPGG